MHCVQFHRAARAQKDRDSKADHQGCCFSRLTFLQRYRNSQLEELVPLGQRHGDSPHSQLAASTTKGLKAAWLVENADRTSFHCPYLPARRQGIVMDALCLAKRKETASPFLEPLQVRYRGSYSILGPHNTSRFTDPEWGARVHHKCSLERLAWMLSVYTRQHGYYGCRESLRMSETLLWALIKVWLEEKMVK